MQITFRQNDKEMTEAQLMQAIRLDAPPGWTLFRNNRGFAYNRSGQMMEFGLYTGASDLIGWSPDGKFVAIEVKTQKGVITRAQQNFIDRVNDAGGIGVIARSLDDLPWKN